MLDHESWFILWRYWKWDPFRWEIRSVPVWKIGLVYPPFLAFFSHFRLCCLLKHVHFVATKWNLFTLWRKQILQCCFLYILHFNCHSVLRLCKILFLKLHFFFFVICQTMEHMGSLTTSDAHNGYITHHDSAYTVNRVQIFKMLKWVTSLQNHKISHKFFDYQIFINQIFNSCTVFESWFYLYGTEKKNSNIHLKKTPKTT